MKPTLTCPTCGLEHQLFWRVDGNREQGKQLYYRCNKAQHMVEGERGPELRSFNELRMAGTVEGAEQLNLPVEWTNKYKKEQQGKQQGQLVLMYSKQ